MRIVTLNGRGVVAVLKDGIGVSSACMRWIMKVVVVVVTVVVIFLSIVIVVGMVVTGFVVVVVVVGGMIGPAMRGFVMS